MQQCQSIMTARERNHRLTGRRGCWDLRGHSVPSKMGTLKSIAHYLSPNDDSTEMSERREPPINMPEHTAGRFLV